MEKTLTIDGRTVKFKCSGGTLMRYRNQFNSEFLADLSALKKVQNDAAKINFAVIENMIWTFAKTADTTVPDPQTWYDSFDEINIYEVWTELSDLVSQSVRSLTKNAERAANQAAKQ